MPPEETSVTPPAAVPTAPVAPAPIAAPSAATTPSTPAAPPPVAATPVAPAAPRSPVVPDADPRVGDPGWLKARIERASEKAKKELRRELKAEKKATRAAGEEAARVVSAANAEVAAAKVAVDALLGTIPEADRAAIIKAGNGSAIETLKSFALWQSAKGISQPAIPAPVAPVAAPPAGAAPPAVAPLTPTAGAPLAAPATTTPPGAAPMPPGGPAQPEDHKAVYADLRATNPLVAAQYLNWHRNEIYPDKKLDWK